MIQNIWQILWLLGFSNSPGLAPFPGDLKGNPKPGAVVGRPEALCVLLTRGKEAGVVWK